MAKTTKKPINKKIDMDTFFDELEERFPDILIRDTEIDRPITVLPTGITSLDVSLGIGGIPKGKFTEIFGPESCGKTALALQIAIESLKLKEKVLYVDVEQTTDMSRVKDACGEYYNEDYFTLIKPRLMEDALRICEVAVESGKYQTVILDSIAAMTPKKVVEDDLLDANVALLAGRLKIFLQRNQYNVRVHNVAFIGLNQLRDTMGTYYPTFHTPGGWSWRHQTTVRIELKRGEKIKQTIGEEVKILGISIPFTIAKNKLAPPYRSYQYSIMFDSGGKIDVFSDIVEFSTTCGIITKASGYYKFNDEVIAHGKEALIEKLKNDKLLLDKIKDMCYNTVIRNVKEIDENGTKFGEEDD